MKKPSFLERLTGSVNLDALDDNEFEHDEGFDDEMGKEEDEEDYETDESRNNLESTEGELPVDMYQTDDAIIIRALIAGVSPEDLDIAITRDMVTIKGERQESQEASDEDYYHRELFWGSFARTIVLPEEVVIDEAEAKEKHGLLEITLSKLDKNRSARLSVKSHHK